MRSARSTIILTTILVLTGTCCWVPPVPATAAGRIDVSDSVLILGFRPEWAAALEPIQIPLPDGGPPSVMVPAVFATRFEISGGEIGDHGFILGTIVVGPMFWGMLPTEEPFGFSQVVFDFGVKAGGTVTTTHAHVLIGPRFSFDIGLSPDSAMPGGGFVPYGTFGATIGILSREPVGRARFIIAFEPGVVAYSTPFFTLGITVGAVL
jgi:hypothetical protein